MKTKEIKTIIKKRYGIELPSKCFDEINNDMLHTLFEDERLEMILKILVKFIAFKHLMDHNFSTKYEKFVDNNSVHKFDREKVINVMFGIDLKHKMYLKHLREKIDSRYPNLAISHLWNFPICFFQTVTDRAFIAFRDNEIVPNAIKEYIDFQSKLIKDEDEIAAVKDFLKLSKDLFSIVEGISRLNYTNFMAQLAEDLRNYDIGYAYWNTRNREGQKANINQDFIDCVYQGKLTDKYVTIEALNNVSKDAFGNINNVRMYSWSRLNAWAGLHADQWIEFIGIALIMPDRYADHFNKLKVYNHKESKKNHGKGVYYIDNAFDFYMIGAYLYEYIRKNDTHNRWFFKFIKKEYYDRPDIHKLFAEKGIPLIDHATKIAFAASTILSYENYIDYLMKVAKNTIKNNFECNEIEEKCLNN